MMYNKFATSLGKILHVCLYIHAIDEWMHCVCLYEFNELTLVWLAPGGTQNSEFIWFHVLFQTIGRMVIVGPTTLK